MFVFMQRSLLVLAAFFLFLAASPAQGLTVGDTAPNIQAKATIGGQPAGFDLHKALANGAVVLYFFPKAFTAG